MSDEDELLQRIRSGSTDEYAEIVRRYQQKVFALLGRYERDPHLLEDLAQETFLKAWRALDQFDPRLRFEQWLSTIAVHVAFDHLRRRKRRPAEVAYFAMDEPDRAALTSATERPWADALEARELLDLAMESLSAAERLVITLMDLEGRSARETSVLTGSSGIAVRVRASRARHKLRRALRRLLQNNYAAPRTLA